MAEQIKKPVGIMETVLRDAHQSLIATRMPTEKMLPIVDTMDKVGYHAVECWGGATFDASLRFLKEDPWERLRQIKARAKNTRLQMLFRGQNILGYRPYGDDVVEYFVQKSIANGIDIIRIFDCLNDLRNLQTAVKASNKEGGHAQIALSYTLGDAYTLEYWTNIAKEIEEMGADSICIKDMAGLLLPYEATTLVTALKEAVRIPIQLHTHYTSGVASMTYLKAVEAGVDIDMDIGYKNIAKMDSEEQFLGRINRSYSEGREGIVYFFWLDAPQKVYTRDIRIEREYMITQPEIWNMLENKDFEAYYGKILSTWKRNYGKVMDEDFFRERVGMLDFPQVKKHMRLIADDRLNISVFLGRRLIDDESGEVIDGNALWQEYKKLLKNGEMGYAEKKVKMSNVLAKMNCFTYQLYQELDVGFDDQIGELFYIADGENYFEDGRLNRKKLTGQLGEFVEFF